MKKTIILTTLGFLIFIAQSQGATILVPGDYTAIQDAIDHSEPGDTVLVSPGTYYELVRLNHDIVLASSDGPQGTIIDGMSQGTALCIHKGVVDGFTVTNGFSSTAAGGVVISGEAIIKNCRIMQNSGKSWGGGILCSLEAQAVILNNLITENECTVTYDDTGFPSDDSYGAGIFIEQGTISALIVNNTMEGNVCHGTGDGYYSGKGGAIWIETGEISIENNIITANQAGECPAVAVYGGTANVSFENNDIWNNIGFTGSCNVPDPEMAVDPLFVSGTMGDHYLSQTAAGQAADSPCLDAGNHSAVFWNLDDLTTRTDDVTDSGIVDLGYHYPCRDSESIVPDISTNQPVFRAGDPFVLALQINNTGETKEIVVFVVLEISQQFIFWPAWSSDVAFEMWNLPSGTIESNLLEFTWPDSTVSGNARFWAAVLDPTSSVLQLNYDYCDFAFE